MPLPGTVSSLLSSTSLALSGYHISQYVLSKNSLTNGVSGNLELSYTGSWRSQMLSRGDRTSAALPSMRILRAGPPAASSTMSLRKAASESSSHVTRAQHISGESGPSVRELQVKVMVSPPPPPHSDPTYRNMDRFSIGKAQCSTLQEPEAEGQQRAWWGQGEYD